MILEKLYQNKYGTDPITDYTRYYALSMTDEYIDMLPDNFFKENGISRSGVKRQLKKLRDAIENTKQLAINENKFNKFGQPSFESEWNVENCAEVWSVRQAILNGAEWDNMAFKCINVDSGGYWCPCENCVRTFIELINLGGD